MNVRVHIVPIPFLQVVRLGHPARLVPTVLQHSLDSLISSSDSAAIIRDVRKEMEQAIVRVKDS